MNFSSLTIQVALEILVPPLLVGIWSKRITNSDKSVKERVYELNKAVLVGVLLAAAMYLPIITRTGIMDYLMNKLGNTSMPLLLQALAFALILISPLLLSIFLILLNASSTSGKITGKEVKVSKVVKRILKFLLMILGPIFGFGLVWWALLIYLPPSLTSKWWFDLLMYSLLILLAFILYPELKVQLGKKKELPPELKEELLRFCRENGVKIRDIVVRENDRIANAMVTGILPGRKYIILTSALVENFDTDEIKAVIAHELGHVKGKHLWINASLMAGWAIFWIAVYWVVSKTEPPLLKGPAGLFALFMVAVLIWDYGIEAKIAIRNEFKADEFAAKTVGVEATIRALEKLSEMSPYPKRTGRWFQAITYHPSIELRVEHLRKFGDVSDELG